MPETRIKLKAVELKLKRFLFAHLINIDILFRDGRYSNREQNERWNNNHAGILVTLTGYCLM